MDNESAVAAGIVGGGIAMIVVFALMAVIVASLWKVFVKAGKPGWAALVPIYNILVLLEIAGKPAWWIALFFVPLANFAVIIMVGIALAKSFGKSAGFGLGLIFLGVVFYPILAFGDARYTGAALPATT